MAERSHLRESGGPEGRSERPATGRGHPRPMRRAPSDTDKNCKSRTDWPWKKSSGTFSRHENLRFSRELRSRDRIPATKQAVYPQPASVLNQKFMTLEVA